MDFWFLFKKSVSLYVHPLTIAMELIVTGVVLIGFSRRHFKKPPGKFSRWLRQASGNLGMAAVISGVFFLFMVSIKPVADPLVFSLEKQYPPLRLDQMPDRQIAELAPEFIVVLAGGERYDPDKPPTSQLSYAALARVNEGVRLGLVFPKATIVFTGQPDEVRAMTEAIISLGISRDRILSESESRDTKDHPRFLRPILGESRFFLVTSGTHMPRAMALFEAEGYEPVAAACDLWVWPSFGTESPYTPENFIPKVEHLWMSHTAFHEYMGLAWAKLREADEKRAIVAPSEEAEMTETVEGKGEASTATAPLPLPTGNRPPKAMEEKRQEPALPPKKKIESSESTSEKLSEPAPRETEKLPSGFL